MTLIVAIEPDRRQANYLSAMVRGRLKAELLLSESAEEALHELGSRVPDVVLTSALLSPKDETIVADWLRTLDDAAHVQTLTIPVFAPSRPRQQRVRGMFAALMGSDVDDTAAAPDGCDPAMFAEQCADYLERARVERATREDEDNIDDREPEVEIVETTVAAEPPASDFVEFDLAGFLEPPAGRTESETPSAPAPDVERIYEEPIVPTSDVWVPPRLGVTRLWPKMDLPESGSRSAVATPQPPQRRVPRGRRPIQDEWGFFDPEQCGFAALLAKLAEITEGDDPPAKRPA